MEIQVAPQRIILIEGQITPENAQTSAWDKRVSAFGTVSKMASLWSAPKDADFELTYQEHRYQPFWHVVAHSKYVYDRSAKYQVPGSNPEVQSLTLDSKEYPIQNGHFHLNVLEHCLSEQQVEVFVDGVTGKNLPDLSRYLSYPTKVVTGPLEKSVSKGTILVPPQARVSAIVRDTLSKMITGIQADKILEENVEVTSIDLVYYPVFAFQYRWVSKNKQAIIDVDGVSGEVRFGSRVFSEYLGQILDKNFLFDVGADAAGMFIPGGSIAVKVAKKYLDTKKKR